jgi:hypothetical protein
LNKGETMKSAAALIALAFVIGQGCLVTPKDAQGPASVVYNVNVTQTIADGKPVSASTTIMRDDDTAYETTGGINLFIGSYERDKAVKTQDDNSQAKNATANDTLKVTP